MIHHQFFGTNSTRTSCRVAAGRVRVSNAASFFSCRLYYPENYNQFTIAGARRNHVTWQVSSSSTKGPSSAAAQQTKKKNNAVALPRNILLLRHGESLGNQDESLFATTPDWKIPLSNRGRRQARAAGRRIVDLIGPSAPILFYVSPYLRTKQTLEELHLPNPVLYTREEPRLREQDFGNFQDAVEMKRAKRERPKYGRFFFRFLHGESGADVFDRVSAFSGTFLRDMEQLGAEDAANATAIFVTHGITSRLFVTKWFHWSVDEFEELHNPPNCGLLHLVRAAPHPHAGGAGYYQLTEESRQLIKGPVPQCESGIGSGLQFGARLLEERRRRRHQCPTVEEREAFDSLPNSAWGL